MVAERSRKPRTGAEPVGFGGLVVDKIPGQQRFIVDSSGVRLPETERLRLRDYKLSDERALFDVFADPYARTFYPEMSDRAKVRAWIEWNLRNYEQFGFGLWAIELKTSGGFIGDCGLTYQDVEGRSELEIGYHIASGGRRKGYATEAARASLDFGFRRTSCASICSIVRPANEASCTVAARLHTARREFVRKGRPALLFFTTRLDWESGLVDLLPARR